MSVFQEHLTHVSMAHAELIAHAWLTTSEFFESGEPYGEIRLQLIIPGASVFAADEARTRATCTLTHAQAVELFRRLGYTLERTADAWELPVME